jgi:hypothetical protein
MSIKNFNTTRIYTKNRTIIKRMKKNEDTTGFHWIMIKFMLL